VVLGLRGAAAENETGEVTIESLMSYVKLKVPTTQPAGFAGKMVHRFVLTRNHPKLAQSRPQFEAKEFSASTLPPARTSTGQIDIQPLESPFEGCLLFIDELVEQISAIRPSNLEPGSQILEVVRKLYEAKLVFVLRIQNNKPDLRFYNEAETKDISSGDLINMASQRIMGAMGDKRFHNGNVGLIHRLPAFQSADWGAILPSVIIIPLMTNGYSDFMVIFGTPMESYLGELFAQVLKTLYFVTNELTVIPFDPKTLLPSAGRLEASILDELKAAYGYVPFKLYEKRFELFQTSLKETKVAFEPILYLDPVNLHIWGWECLAREDGADHAPVHLFKSAELWGSRFMVELDIHFIQLATQRYRELLTKNKIRRGHELPLSVNVYPASLMRSAYKRAVGETIGKSVLGEKLVIEISEKLPIVADTPMSDARALEAFKNRIVQYTKDYRINFAIDDFGVGYSSVARLANLNPSYVKIDRDILLQKDFCDLTLQYVKQMVDVNKTSPPVVVIEGFDGSTDMAVSLRRLYDDGIRYVQGYVIGRAGAELYDLDEEVERYLRNELE
jgi:EAL domain-containing protein (putative c-di-GMP-specific phosphodiesterase class I)